MQNDRHPFIMLFYQIKLTEQIAQPRTLLFAQIRDFFVVSFPHNRLMKSQALRYHLHYPKNSNFQRPFSFRFSINYTAKFSFRLNVRFNFSRNFFKRGSFPPLSINYTRFLANRLLFIRNFSDNAFPHIIFLSF